MRPSERAAAGTPSELRATIDGVGSESRASSSETVAVEFPAGTASGATVRRAENGCPTRNDAFVADPGRASQQTAASLSQALRRNVPLAKPVVSTLNGGRSSRLSPEAKVTDAVCPERRTMLALSRASHQRTTSRGRFSEFIARAATAIGVPASANAGVGDRRVSRTRSGRSTSSPRVARAAAGWSRGVAVTW